MQEFGALSDDQFVNMTLNTEMQLPSQRETVLDFFGRVQRSYPTMCNFFQRGPQDFVLEEEKDPQGYRWMRLESKRLASGVVNPPSLDAAMEQHLLCLELAPYMLSVTPLDSEAIDFVVGFDFNYRGNHDELVAEALGITPALEGLMGIPGARPIKFEPSLTLLLDAEGRRQCRLFIETRTTAYQVRRNHYPDDVISVYFSVRQYRNVTNGGSLKGTLQELRFDAERLINEYVVNQILRPLASTISRK